MTRPLPKEQRCHPWQQDSPPLPTTPPDTPCAYACISAVCIVLAPPRAPPKKSTPIFHIVTRAIPNCGAATSSKLSMEILHKQLHMMCVSVCVSLCEIVGHITLPGGLQL